MPSSYRDGRPGARAHLPAWALERLAYEPSAAPPEAAAHRAVCGRCQEAVACLEAAQEAFRATHPAAPFLAAVHQRAAAGRAPPRPAWRLSRPWIVGAAAMVAIVVMLVSGRGLAPPDEVRFKGGAPQFTLFVSSAGDAARPLERGDTLRSGDVIRFGVVAPRPAHAFVASIDERGTFTRYFPSSQRASAPLDGREYLQVLPGSVRLDDSAGLEWIVLVLSATALPQERVEEALRAAWRDGGGGALGPVALDAELRVVQVRKVAP